MTTRPGLAFSCSLAMLAATCLAAAADSVTVGSITIDFADASLAPRTEQQKVFVAAFRAAVAAKSMDSLRALVHPASLTCNASETSQAYLSTLHERMIEQPLPPDAQIAFVPLVGREWPNPLPGKTMLPLAPEQLFAVNIKQDVRDANGTVTRRIERTIFRPVSLHDGALRLVDYCLTQEGEAMLRDKKKQ